MSKPFDVLDIDKHPDKDITADYFYHGCTDSVLQTYYEQEYLWNSYYKGLWITPDIWHALHHGINLFRIDALYLDQEMDWNNNDDGILYKGKVFFYRCHLVSQDKTDEDYSKVQKFCYG